MIRTETEYSETGLIIARDYEKCCAAKCHHVSNDDYYARPFLLEDFQRENIWKPLFACGEIQDGKFIRKHKRAIIGLPSGFGKTEIAAAITMTLATMEIVYNGQYGVVASSKDQVRNIFDKIATMIKLDSDWREQWIIGKSVITHKETNAKIMVLPNKADALESWHFNVLIFDELHVYRDDKVWAAGLKGQKVIPNALSIGITTAADCREGFLWETLEKADKDEGMYVYWLGLDDTDDIEKKSSWEKMMVASWVTWASIQDQRGSASSDRAFERYTANRFPSKKGKTSCFTAQQLDELTRRKNDFDFQRPWTMGIDGATSGDSFAIVGYQKLTNSKGEVVENTIEWIFDEPDEETGYYPIGEITELIADVCAKNYPAVIGIDPNRMIVMANQLKDTYGLDPVSFAQNNATMCQATSLVINSVKAKTLRLRGCSKLKSHLMNTVEDDKGSYGVRFSKDEKKSKIDGAIALAIAELAFDKLVDGAEYVPFN